MPAASPEVAYNAPNMVNTPAMAHNPSVAYTPTTYIANPTANPDPLFFGLMGGMYGGSITADGFGGKVS